MSLICLFIFSIVIIANFFRTKIIEKKILNILVILFFIFFYNYQSILFAKKNNKQFFFRKDFSEINLALQKKDIKLSKEANILSFNDMIHTWWILSGYKNLSLINTSFTPITDEESENRMIHVFKYLKLNVDDFLIFFGNRKEGHRYFNKNVGDFLSHMKYQANSLTTFNDSKNFDEEIKNFILNTSPTVSRQTAIPKEEFERLKKKFLEVRNFNYKEPDLIIFKKDANVNIMKKIKVDSDKFCNLISNKTYAVYIKHSKIKNCKSID